MRNIYCIGETVYDIIFKNGQPIAAKAGGSMLNSTVSMGRMKLPVHFISEFGLDDIGNGINTFLQQCNVNTKYVYQYSQGKTSIAIAFLNEKNDANYSFYKNLPDTRLAIDFPKINQNDIVLFGSFYSINKEIREQVKNFVLSAKENGAIVIYDPNYRKAHLHELEELKPYILENMQLASIVRGSNEDFEMIFGSKNLQDAFKNVSPYCKLLIYSNSSEGVYLKNENQETFVPSKKIEPISTIGAGDNFNAGVILGLIHENINSDKLENLAKPQYDIILQHGINFATEVCMSYENYISETFASQYLTKYC